MTLTPDEQSIRADERKRILGTLRAFLKLSPHIDPQYHGQYAQWSVPPTLPVVISRLEEMLKTASLSIWRDPLFCMALERKIKKHRQNLELFQKWEIMIQDALKGAPGPEASDEELEEWARKHKIVID